MLGIFANNHHVAFSLDDFALFANLLDGRLNFHCFIPFLFRLFFSPGDTAFGKVVGRNLYRYGVTGENFDIIHTKFTRNVSSDDVLVRELYQKCCIRECFHYGALFKCYNIVLSQNYPSKYAVIV